MWDEVCGLVHARPHVARWLASRGANNLTRQGARSAALPLPRPAPDHDGTGHHAHSRHSA